MEIFMNIAAVVGCISACVTLAVTIIKPFRNWIINSFIRQSQYEQLITKVNQIDQKMDKALNQSDQLDARLTRVEENVLANEADRIRAELFDYGNRCRRGIRLHPEEFEHIRDIFHKYKDVLHQNHEGETEFHFIYRYYNNQDFPAYHSTNNN